MSEREKMLSGELYDPSDPELKYLRIKARKLARKYKGFLVFIGCSSQRAKCAKAYEFDSVLRGRTGVRSPAACLGAAASRAKHYFTK